MEDRPFGGSLTSNLVHSDGLEWRILIQISVVQFIAQYHVFWASLVAQMVKNLPAVQETGF